MSVKRMITTRAIQEYHTKVHGAGLVETEFEKALVNLAVYMRNKKNPCKESTIKNKQGYLRTLYKKYGFEFTPEFIDRIRLEMCNEGVKNNSQVMILYAVEFMFKANGYNIPVNKPRLIETHKDSLSEEQVLRIIEAATFSRDRAILATLYYSAMRTIELQNLMVNDVDFKDGYLHVRQEGGLKTGKSRKIPVPPICLSYIKEWLAFRRQFGSDEEYPYLFVSSANMDRLSRHRISGIVDHYAEIVGLKVSPHGFRRARATHLANVENWPISYVQRIMGHSSWNTTQHYVSVNDDLIREFMMKKYKNQ